MTSLRFFLLVNFAVACGFACAQTSNGLIDADKKSLEGVVVEKYYTADLMDYKDTVGGVLPKGAITYRIYIDLKPGYTLQAVYGVTNHQLRIATTSYFFNNTFHGGAIAGDQIDKTILDSNTVALDSWVSVGAAADAYLGILKSEDKDGSIIKKRALLKKSDGLVKGKIKPAAYFGIDLAIFHTANSTSVLATDNGSWAAFGGVKGPTEDNKILIAQLTTAGKLSFELNVMVGCPSGASIYFVAKNPENDEVQFEGLNLKH